MNEQDVVDGPQFSPTPVHVGMLLFAGAGSLDAQRDARDSALHVAGTEDAPVDQAIAVAEVMAWMALRSGDPADFRSLASILVRRAEELSPRRHHRSLAYAQAISILDLAADIGDPEATKMLADVTDRAPADAIPQAKMLKEDWLQMVEDINAQIEAAA